jgi:phosphate transport system protein
MRTQFHNGLDRIRENIALLGAQANQATARAVQALIARDFEAAREVKRSDRTLDQLRYDVENDCLGLIATQQPVARDLRMLAAATLVAVELERCGDYAKGIAKAARRISRANPETVIPSYNLTEMSDFARGMLDRAVNAFIGIDTPGARAVIQDDAHMDQLYNGLLARVIADMTANTIHIESGTWLLHAGHCLERMADRATNIAERFIFVETGDLVNELNGHLSNAERYLRPGRG